MQQQQAQGGENRIAVAMLHHAGSLSWCAMVTGETLVEAGIDPDANVHYNLMVAGKVA